MHPVLFSIGDFFIGTYGVMIALGLLAAIALGSWRASRRGIPPESVTDMAFTAIIAGFVSARILYILLNWGAFTADPVGLMLSRSGFVFLGGFVGAAAACIWFLRKRDLPVLAMGDLVAPSLALGHAFGRIGCHFAGCCYGGVCTVPAVGLHVPPQETPSGQPFGNAYTDQVLSGAIPADAAQSLPVWPVQLLESGSLFVVTGLLLWWASRPRAAGSTLGLYLVAYSVLRFLLEYLRGDAERGFLIEGAVSTSQGIALLLLPVGVWLMVRARGKEPSPYSHPSVAPALPEKETQEEKGAGRKGRR